MYCSLFLNWLSNVILLMKTRLLWSNDLRRMRDDGYQQKSVLGASEDHGYIFVHVRYLFPFIFLSSKWKKSLSQLDTDWNWSNSENKLRLVSHVIFWSSGWFKVKIQFWLILGEEVLRGLNRKNGLFVSQSIDNPKLYDICKNQSPRSKRRGKYERFSFIWPLKRAIPPLSPL